MIDKNTKRFCEGIFWGLIFSSLFWIGIIYLICVASEAV